jgi:hypothetical protein
MEQVKPLLIGRNERLHNLYAENWDIAKADLQKVVDCYNVTGLPVLTLDDLDALLKDADVLIFDKMTGGHAHFVTSTKEHLPIDKKQAFNILIKPNGYNKLIEAINNVKTNSTKGYSNSHQFHVRIDLSDLSKHFKMEDGQLQFSEQLQAELDEAGNSYAKTEKGIAAIQFCQDIARAWKQNKLNVHFPWKGLPNDFVPVEAIAHLLSQAMQGFTLSDERVIPVVKNYSNLSHDDFELDNAGFSLRKASIEV